MSRPSVSSDPQSGPVVSADYRGNSSEAYDWRVSLTVPSSISAPSSKIGAPLHATGDKMIFPFNPSIIMGQSAQYSDISPTHSNYAFNAYQSSRISDITISGEFMVENETDAKYWLASLHFLRTVTKMFYGNSNNQGNPPPVSRLNGYGRYVLNNIPVVIKDFTVDLMPDIDYIPCEIGSSVNYVPVQSNVQVTVAPNYSRRTVAKFNLKTFARGWYTNGGSANDGFI